MAAVTLLRHDQDTSNVATYTSGSFTPTAGSLLVIFVYAHTTIVTPTLTGSANSLTFTNVKTNLGDASTAVGAIFIADQLTPGSPVAMTVSSTYTADPGNGCSTIIYEVSGMSKTGAAAALQTAGADNNQTAGTTPTITFASAPQSGNPTIAVLGNNTNPPGTTAPTGYTLDVDSGYLTPTAGSQAVHKDSSGSTTITWTGGTTSRGLVLALELDSSASGSAFTFTPTDDAVPTDAATFSVGKNVTDNVVPTDAVNFAVGKDLGTDNAGPTDAGLVAFTVGKALGTDDAGVSDALTFALFQGFFPVDDVKPTDAVTFALGKNVTDNVVPTDTVAFVVGKSLGIDSAGVSDTLTFVLTIGVVGSIADNARAWLTSLGYTGSLPDMQYKYVLDRYTATFGAPSSPLTVGDMMTKLGKPVRRYLISSEWP